MGHDLLFDVLLFLGLLWLSMLVYWAWLQGRPAASQTTPTPARPIKARSKAPLCPATPAHVHTRTPAHRRHAAAVLP